MKCGTKGCDHNMSLQGLCYNCFMGQGNEPRTPALELTKLELQYLLNLAQFNKYDGCYFGRRDHYYKRQDKVLLKLDQELRRLEIK